MTALTSCSRSLKMSMTATLKMSMQKRAFRARDRRLVLMVAACCSRCRGARRGWRRGGHGERRGQGPGMPVPGLAGNDQLPGAGAR